MANVIVGLALLAFWLYCIFDVITTPGESVRGLRKSAWVLIALVPAVGGILWLLGGRPIQSVPDYIGEMPATGPRGPDDDPEFLRQLERRILGED